ncbi:hypothetical protein KVV02_008009 [Mortierella alpina]|uniref:Mitogen-activated protein kinase n=1 Tax=Mortierella alpina TaxID=64518 RepID=A0A9P8A9J9_MORAP|nr:hypothetical protein KVV02_008009 [Mortierella alpina]
MPSHSFPVLNQQFIVDTKYKFIREIGQGAYGVVCAAKNTQSGEDVAIKKVTKVFEKAILAKRALREVKLLKHFSGHENITSILDMDITNVLDFNEIYLVQELMEADLHQIIRSEQPLTDAHFQYFIYQICRGLKYIHSANVLHRDLKPGNLLVNADCELKICDFGLARGFSDDAESNVGFMTEYVATRWYRAPEIMLSFQSYTKAIDMWSVGCIFAEMLGGKPLFKGRDYVDQLNQILQILGTPDEATLRRIGSERAQAYIRSLPKMPTIHFQQLYPRASPLAIDLLEKLLNFDPAARITVEQALAHPYLAAYHEEDDEPVHESVFDFAFETTDRIDDMKRLIAQEVMSFKASKEQAMLGLQNGGLRRAASLSAADRSATTSAAKNTPQASQQPILEEEPAMAEEAAPSNHHMSSAMDIDEDLERELSGQTAHFTISFASTTHSSMANARNGTPDCAIDVPIGAFDEDDPIIQLCHDSVLTSRPQQEHQKCYLCRQEQCVHVSSTRPTGNDIQEHDPEEITGCVHKWYLKECQAGAVHAESTNASASTQSAFQCTEEYQPPIKRDASIRYTSWLLNTDMCKEKTHTIILAMSTKDLQIDGIESITFSLSSDCGKSHYAVERITRQRLQSLILPTTGMSKWQLYRELDASACKGDQMLTMEVRLSNEALFSQLNPGSIEIQFIELNSQRPKSLGLHGNGDYVVTLSATLRQLILELWDLRCAPRSARLLATMRIPLEQCEDSKDLRPEYPFAVALSWDASQIAVFYRGFYHREPPLLPDFQDHFGLYRSTNTHAFLPSVTDYRRCTKLHNFEGAAMFHILEPATQDASDELFVATNGMDVQIYSVHGEWKLIRTITLALSERVQSNTFSALECVRSLYGRFFPQYDNYNNVMVIWDIVQGTVASYIPRKGPSTMWMMLDDAKTSISDDGVYLAFYRQGEITTYRRASGTLLQANTLPPLYEDVSDMRFIRKNSHILIFTQAQDEEFGPGKLGLILDVATLSIQDRFVLPSSKVYDWYSRYGNDTQLYFTTREGFGLVDFEDCIVRPYSRRYLTRHEHCAGPLTPLNRQPISFSSAELVFTARITSSAKPRQTPSSSVVVYVTNSSSLPRTFTIPPLTERPREFCDSDDTRNYHMVAFLGDLSHLVVTSPDTLMIWALPTTIEGDFSLLLVWSTARLPCGNTWVTCPHQQLYSRDLQSEAGVPPVYPDAEHPFTGEHAEPFLDGLATALELFVAADDDTCRRAILRYVSSHINSYPVSGDSSANVISTICRTWELKSHEMHEQFTAALLSPGYARWIPRHDMDRQMNPIVILLEKCKTEPRAIDLAEVIIEYCIRQTKEEKDLTFLLPVMQCLGDLAAKKKPHWDLALRILQQLAYLPVKKRSYIVDNHKIAYPIGSQLSFWKKKLSPIYKCKDPVLQLVNCPWGRDSQNENFTRDLHVAPFDFLWHYRADRCKLKSDTVAIECHDLTLEAFDNPALMALIEYKWNTIGFKYWLARFLFQCCYYILVITAVLMQVYPINNLILPGMFIAIIVLACIFLWLEAIQLVRDWRRYLSSVYNYVDLAAFVLPLAGSINQVVAPWSKDGTGSSSGVLSFSILFVFLHVVIADHANGF